MPTATRAMVTISPAVDDDADPLAAANGGRAPGPVPAAANNLDPAAALLSLFDAVHGTPATADDVTPWWSSPPPPCLFAGSGVYAGSSSFPPAPPPPLQSHGGDLACCYAGGSITDTSFPQLPAAPPPVCMPPELSYFYYPQPFPLQVPTAQPPASTPPSTSLHCYPQTQAAAAATTTTTTTGSPSAQEASPAIADTQQAQENDDDTSRPAPRRRRGRPCKRAAAVSDRRVAVVGSKSNRAASSSSSSQKTSSAATGSPTMSSSAADQEAGATSSSTGSTSSGQQQTAAPPPPELTTMTPGPQYADTSPVGVRFHPTDQELVGYLRMKYGRQKMPVDFFKEFDVYQAHPMAIKEACGEGQNGCWYAFSRRDRKYRNGKRPARSVFAADGGGGQQQQVGFWKSNSKLGDVRAGGKKDGAVVGRMTSLTFQLGRQPRGKQTGWKMKEYTIPENQHQPDGSAMLLNDWVVCKLFYKERPTCTATAAKRKTDENAISVAVVGQKRPKRSRKSKKDKNAIRAAVGLEDEPGEAAGESVPGEEDMQPQMVPTAVHQASDYSEHDLCVEDYLVCDVAFEQQNDTANNCTI